MKAGTRSPIEELITRAALDSLLAHPWPGNIRQLEQTVRGLLALRIPPAPVGLDDLPETMRTPREEVAIGAGPEESMSPLEAAEQQVIRRVLREHGGNVSATARSLGISRTTIYAKLERPQP
jgi:transcriptional regulator of acetoin/glycerol metabolism